MPFKSLKRGREGTEAVAAELEDSSVIPSPSRDADRSQQSKRTRLSLTSSREHARARGDTRSVEDVESKIKIERDSSCLPPSSWLNSSRHPSDSLDIVDTVGHSATSSSEYVPNLSSPPSTCLPAFLSSVHLSPRPRREQGNRRVQSSTPAPILSRSRSDEVHRTSSQVERYVSGCDISLCPWDNGSPQHEATIDTQADDYALIVDVLEAENLDLVDGYDDHQEDRVGYDEDEDWMKSRDDVNDEDDDHQGDEETLEEGISYEEYEVGGDRRKSNTPPTSIPPCI